ncbi:hypothetical protein GW17_00009892, partial [Ensete ventricosum]
MGLLCPNSLPAAISRVRYFPSYQSGVPDPTFRRFGPSRFYRRPPPSMAAFLPHENIGPVAAPKSPCRIGDVKRVTKETDVYALLQALGDRKGIYRFGHFAAPLDEAAIEVILILSLLLQDLSGRPHLSYDLIIPTERVGTYDTQVVLSCFCSASGAFLSISCEHLWDDPSHPPVIVQLAGKNSHHIIEATFKAFARALRQAIEYDSRRGGSVP